MDSRRVIMDIKTLKQYKYLVREKEKLEERIIRLENNHPAVECGIVKGSMDQFPYIQKNYRVSGYNIKDDVRRRRKIEKYRLMLKEQRDKCIQQELEITEFINGIFDSRARLALTYVFIDGESQEEVGKKLGIDRSVVSRIITQYVSK